MHKFSLNFFLFAVALSLFISAPAFADRPAWAGNHKGGEHGHEEGKNWNKGKNKKDFDGYQNDRGESRDDQGENRNYRSGNYVMRNFDDRQRGIIYDYFGPRFRGGRCPPGLAKKHNGCLPPGQAKQWRMGYPLPPNVIFYNLPPTLIGQLGYPAPGYRYVRVAADILLIAIGTGMVVDAIQDLNTL